MSRRTSGGSLAVRTTLPLPRMVRTWCPAASREVADAHPGELAPAQAGPDQDSRGWRGPAAPAAAAMGLRVAQDGPQHLARLSEGEDTPRPLVAAPEAPEAGCGVARDTAAPLRLREERPDDGQAPVDGGAGVPRSERLPVAVEVVGGRRRPTLGPRPTARSASAARSPVYACRVGGESPRPEQRCGEVGSDRRSGAVRGSVPVTVRSRVGMARRPCQNCAAASRPCGR